MQTVLFVCTGNYYRSRYAELRFNALVPPALGWRAESRGFAPSPLNPGPINADVLERLGALGMLPQGAPRQPQTLLEADLQAAGRIIALDEDEHAPYVASMFPRWRERFAYWRVADLHAMTVPEALGALDALVDELIAELGQAARQRKSPL
jgi:protein-tyrosine phosphatase